MIYFKEFLYAFCASIAFSVVFGLKKERIFLAAFGGGMGWLFFSLFKIITDNEIARCFLATLIIASYAEIMARKVKSPVSIFLVISLMPLVPGGGIYQTMYYLILGNISAAIKVGLNTLGMAGALAIGIVIVSSIVRIFSIKRQKNKAKKECT